MGANGVSGSQPLQAFQGPSSTSDSGFETVQLKHGGQSQDVQVSQKKGRFAALSKIVRVVKNAPSYLNPLNAFRTEAPVAGPNTKTYSGALAAGKIAVVPPQAHIPQQTAPNSEAPPVPPHSPKASRPSTDQRSDLSRLSDNALVQITQNQREPAAIREAAIQQLEQRSSPSPVQTQDQPPPLPEKSSQPQPRPVSVSSLSPQEIKQEALALAENHDTDGLTQLLEQTTDYQLVKETIQGITAMLGSKQLPEAKIAMKRMIGLKYHDVLKQAKESGITNPAEIKAFAKKTLANHAYFSKHAPTILNNLDSLLAAGGSKSVPRPGTGSPQLPRKSEAVQTESPPPIPSRSHRAPGVERTQSVGSPTVQNSIPGAEKLADYYGQGAAGVDHQTFIRDFTAGLNLLVENRITTRATIEKAISDIERNGDPLIDPEGVYALAQRTAKGSGSITTPEMVNHKYYVELQEYTRSHPVQMIPTDNARFRDIKSPASTNVPLLAVNPETGKLQPQKGKIHANYIPLSGRSGAIATQYPKGTAQAKADFWKMTLQQKTNMVVDLTQQGEKGIAPYYPTTVGLTQTFGDVQVTLVEQNGNQATYHVVDASTGQSGEVSRYHYQDWVDKTAISEEQLSDLAAFVAGQDDICIHCKAGVGRTVTTFAAADLYIKMKAGKITPDNVHQVVNDTIKPMRAARGPNAVQTESQRASLVQLVQYWMENGIP